MKRAAPPPLNALRTFEAFARHRSMTRAAEELCVTHGAVSRQVAALQASMGVPLVTGPRHALTLTEAGAQLAERLTQGFGLIDDAVLAARHGQSREIEISCLGTVALKWLIPRLQGFLDAHPDVRVRLSESYRRVDFRRDRFDGAVRIIEPDQDMTGQEATPFMPQHQGPVCSPAVAASLTSMEALMRAPRLRSATFRRSWASWAELVGGGPAARDRRAGVRAQSFDDRGGGRGHRRGGRALGLRRAGRGGGAAGRAVRLRAEAVAVRLPAARGAARRGGGRLPRLAGGAGGAQPAAARCAGAYSFDRS